MGLGGRLGTAPSSSSDPSSSSSDVAGDSDCGSFAESSEKSSRDTVSEGDVIISGDCWSGWRVEGVAMAVIEPFCCKRSNEPRVGRFGVDLDWKPFGTGGSFVDCCWPSPLL